MMYLNMLESGTSIVKLHEHICTVFLSDSWAQLELMYLDIPFSTCHYNKLSCDKKLQNIPALYDILMSFFKNYNCSYRSKTCL